MDNPIQTDPWFRQFLLESMREQGIEISTGDVIQPWTPEERSKLRGVLDQVFRPPTFS
jgi:hypothetical protein